MLREPCWQCDLDIPHVCYHGDSNASWGLNDSAIEALEAAQRYLNPPRARKVNHVPTSNSPVSGLRIPDGWTIEMLPRTTDHALISTPSPLSLMVTIDFKLRGFRMGYSTTAGMVGEAWNKKRKKYGGRNWKQVLVDDAVAHLQEVLR